MGELLLFFLFVAGVFLMFRGSKKKTYYGQTLGDAPSPYEHPGPPILVSDNDLEREPSEEPEKMSLGKRIGGIVFLSIWLTIWSFGCYVALTTAAQLSYGEEGYIFLRVWLAMAIPAWFLAAWTLFRLLRGDHVEFSFDGDGGGDGGD